MTVLKVLLLLFFTFTAPVVLFIASVLYGTSASTLKGALANANIYTQLSKVLANIDSGDTNSAEINTVLSKRLTPDYLQTKTEKALDDSQNWITGKTTTPPVISFSEIKQDMLAQNPELIDSLKNIPTQTNSAEPSSDTSSTDPSATEQPNTDQAALASISKLAKQDFTLPLAQYLDGFKVFHNVMQIALPIVGVLLLGSLLLIVLFSQGTASKLKWLASTLFVSALWGFGIIFFQTLVVTIVTQLAQSNSNDVVSVVSPVVLEIMKQYMHSFINYQGIAGITILVLAAGSFILASLIHNPLQPTQKAVVPAIKKTPTPKKKK